MSGVSSPSASRRRVSQGGSTEQPQGSLQRPPHLLEDLFKAADYLESGLQNIPETAITRSLGLIVKHIRDQDYFEEELEMLRTPIKEPSESPSGDIPLLVALANQYRSELAELYRSALEASSVQSNHEVIYELIGAHQKAIEDGREAPAPSDATKLAKHPKKIGRLFETTGPPVSTYHHVFSDFQTDIQDPNFEPEPRDEVFAYLLIQVAAKVHRSKEDRVSLMKRHLGTLLHRTIAGNSLRHKIRPDGVIWLYVQDSGDVPLLVIQAENEIGIGGSDPDIQGSFSFRNLWRDDLRLISLQNVCCCPSFILSVAGPNITIHGGVITEFIVQPLTETIRLANLPDPYERTKYIAKIMAALRKCLNKLVEFYDSLVPANKVQPARYSPFFQEYAGFTLTYTSPNLLSDRIGRAMFDAILKGPGEGEGSPVKVKFTPRYCKKAHTLLAEKNLAPKLRHFEELKNGWKVVVMDFVAGPDLPSVGLTAVPPQALKDIERAIDVLHEADLVFGDLRRPNIMLCKRDAQGDQVEEGAMLVEFDWAGEHGKQRYTPSLDPHVKWPKVLNQWGI